MVMEAGAEVRRHAGDPGPDQRAALLAATMEEVLRVQGVSPEALVARREVQVAASTMSQKMGATAVVAALLSVRV